MVCIPSIYHMFTSVEACTLSCGQILVVQVEGWDTCIYQYTNCWLHNHSCCDLQPAVLMHSPRVTISSVDLLSPGISLNSTLNISCLWCWVYSYSVQQTVELLWGLKPDCACTISDLNPSMWHKLKILHSDWYNYCYMLCVLCGSFTLTCLKPMGQISHQSHLCATHLLKALHFHSKHTERRIFVKSLFFLKALIIEAVNIMPVVNSEDQ